MEDRLYIKLNHVIDLINWAEIYSYSDTAIKHAEKMRKALKDKSMTVIGPMNRVVDKLLDRVVREYGSGYISFTDLIESFDNGEFRSIVEYFISSDIYDEALQDQLRYLLIAD